MQFAALQAALEHWEALAAEGMMASRNAHVLDVTGIQPRSMLVVVLASVKGMPAVAYPLNRYRSRTSAARRTVETPCYTVSANVPESINTWKPLVATAGS